MSLGRYRNGAAASALVAPPGIGPTQRAVRLALVSDRIEDTAEFLKSAAPRLSTFRRATDRGIMLDLPMPDGAQYQVSLLPELPEIVTRLLPPLDRAVFWSWPFLSDRYGSPEQCEAEFFRCVGLMLANPTRIVQRRGVVRTRFSCYALTADGRVPIGGSIGALLSVDVPEICGRQCTYASPPLLSASVAQDGRHDR